MHTKVGNKLWSLPGHRITNYHRLVWIYQQKVDLIYCATSQAWTVSSIVGWLFYWHTMYSTTQNLPCNRCDGCCVFFGKWISYSVIKCCGNIWLGLSLWLDAGASPLSHWLLGGSPTFNYILATLEEWTSKTYKALSDILLQFVDEAVSRSLEMETENMKDERMTAHRGRRRPKSNSYW